MPCGEHGATSEPMTSEVATGGYDHSTPTALHDAEARDSKWPNNGLVREMEFGTNRTAFVWKHA